METTELFDLEALEVSLVSKGANKKKFLIFKSDKGEEQMDQEFVKKITDYKISDAVSQKIEKSELSNEGKSAISATLRILNVFKEHLPKDVFKTISELTGIPFVTKIEDPKNATPANSIKKEDLNNLPESIRPKIEELWKQNEEAVKKQERLERELAVERDERIKKEFLEKAHAFNNLGKAEDVGVILKEVFQKAPQIYSKLEEIFKSSNEIIGKSEIFKELGSGQSNKDQNAWEKIEKAAEQVAIQKKISKEEAINEVLQSKPELYQEYLNEKR